MGVLPVGRRAGVGIVRPISMGGDRQVNGNIYRRNSLFSAVGQRVGGQGVGEQPGHHQLNPMSFSQPAKLPNDGFSDGVAFIEGIFDLVIVGSFNQVHQG